MRNPLGHTNVMIAYTLSRDLQFVRIVAAGSSNIFPHVLFGVILLCLTAVLWLSPYIIQTP